MAISALNLSEFTTNLSAHHVDAALKRAVRTLEQAEHNALLWFGEVLRRKLYRKLGYSSINQYAAVELKFSRSKTGDFIRLATKLEELPAVRESVASGKVGYTKAREIIKVATPATEAVWVEAASSHSRRELEKKVATVRLRAKAKRQADPAQQDLLAAESANDASGAAACSEAQLAEIPVRVSLEMSPEQFARYEALWEQLYKQGGVPTGAAKVNLLLEAMACLVEERGGADERAPRGVVREDPVRGESAPRGVASENPVRDESAPRGAMREDPVREECTPRGARGAKTGPRFQVHVHQCPDCSQATVQTSRGERPISRAELERVQCDAQLKEPDKRNRTTIPPAVRRAVLARDRHRCQAPGCENTRFLEIHHLTPRTKCGSNRPENLRTLCSSCHRLLHEQCSEEEWSPIARS